LFITHPRKEPTFKTTISAAGSPEATEDNNSCVSFVPSYPSKVIGSNTILYFSSIFAFASAYFKSSSSFNN